MTDPDFSSRFNVPPELSFEVRYVQASLVLTTALATVAPKPSQDTELQISPQIKASASPSHSPAVTTDEPAMPASPDRAPEPTNAGPQSVATSTTGHTSSSHQNGQGIETAWNAIVEKMRGKSGSVQAVLRSGSPMQAEHGELVIGFEYDFHFNYFADVKKRRLVEEVVEEVLGAAYRVRCVRTTKDELDRLRAARGIPEDDGFIQEAAERLRAYHARELGNGHT